MTEERKVYGPEPRPVRRMRGRPGRMAPGEKPKDFRKSFFKLLKYLGAYKIAIVIVMIFAAFATVFQVAGPKVMGNATTELAEGLMRKIGGTGGIDFSRIAEILTFTFILYTISTVFRFIQGLIMTNVTQNLVYKMRKEISEKIDRMPIKYFESRQLGDILSRITNDVDTLGMGLNQSVTMIITSLATVIGSIVMMLSISPLMTLIALVVLPVAGGFLSFIVRFSQKYFKTQQRALGEINGQIEENFAGQQVIKAFNKEKGITKTFDETNAVLYDSAWKSQFIGGIMNPVMVFVGNMGYAGVAISGGFLAIRGVIGIGDIQAFIQYVKNMTMPLQQIAQVMNIVQSMTAAAERIFEFMEEEEETQNAVTPAAGAESADKEAAKEAAFGKDKTDVSANAADAGKDIKSDTDRGADSIERKKNESGSGRVAGSAGNEKDKSGGGTVAAEGARDAGRPGESGRVTFNHVRFGYDPGTAVIHDFSCDVRPGQKIAIVGPTGAGKTTIVKLLMRFYDVDSGEILLDGRDIRSLDRHELRENFAMVLQDTWLYSGTIMDNIRFGRLDATDEEVIQAAEKASADHFIRTLPGGYDMVLNEDSGNVSQGQKQLLTIARAMLADRRVLILDEATSSVDTRTEERIQEAMDRLMTGRTSFIIAHRLSTIRNADRILVMNHGDIVEQGTHEELLAMNGFYADLYNSQFETGSAEE